MKPTTKVESTVAIHKNSYFFGLYRFQTEAHNVNKLKQLRYENITTEIDFFVGEIAWTEKVVSEMIKTFRYYEGRRWNEGRFHTSLGLIETLRFHRVLRAAIQSRLFRKLRFGGSRAGSSNLGTAYATTLAEIFRNAVGLDRVTLFDFDISSEAASILAAGLVHDENKDDLEGWRGPRELVLEGNRFLWEPPSDEFMVCQNAAVHLAAGLSHNKKLELLSLKNTYLDDLTLSILLESIRGNATLHTLQLSFCDFGPYSMHSLQRVLSHPNCRLQELELSNHVAISRMSHRSFDMSNFILSMPINTSLTSLHLTKQGLVDQDVDLLLQNLWRFPNLMSLDLQLNQLLDLTKVVGSTGGGPRSHPVRTTSIHDRLCRLDLDYNDCMMELTTTKFPTSPTQDVVVPDGPTTSTGSTLLAILELLHMFPRLADLGQEFRQFLESNASSTMENHHEYGFTRYLQHCLDMNQCGGFLLTGSSSREKIPLSLWPLILAKTQELDQLSRQANVVYHLLREGPAFCGRDSCC